MSDVLWVGWGMGGGGRGGRGEMGVQVTGEREEMGVEGEKMGVRNGR